MTYYSDAQEVSDLSGTALAAIKTAWQRDVDGFIEQYTHQSYKGNSKTYTWIGDNNSLIVLPSFGGAITSITENGTALTTDDYNFHSPSRLIERRNTNWQFYPYSLSSRTGVWIFNYEYIVQYTEPATTPDTWRATANQCVALISMFHDKYQQDGIALTTSDSGQAGGRGGLVQSGGAITYPASLMDELNRTIRTGVVRVGT